MQGVRRIEPNNCGHPERSHRAHGKCQSCYIHQRNSVLGNSYKPATCHPDRRHTAKGLCDKCYRNHIRVASGEVIRRKEQRAVMRAWLEQEKSKPCKDCGKSYPYYVMDFDHVRGEKRKNLGAVYIWKRETLEAEIAKCDLVCSNCHRIRTHLRSQGHSK